MSFKTLGDKILFAASTVHTKRTMAHMPARETQEQFCMTVGGVEELNDVVRRITFVAPELRSFTVAAPDEYFGLLMPQPGQALTMPDCERLNVRGAINDLPEEQQPDLRWYTIREHRPEVGEICVDIITHGDDGPGSAWARRARVGDEVGFRSGGALYGAMDCDGTQLLVADETAVPALVAVLAERERRGLPQSDLRVHVEVPHAGVLTGMGVDDKGVTVHERGEDAPGSAVAAALRADATQTAGLAYAWVCGESALSTGLRRHLTADCGVAKTDVLFSGYWKLGAARG